MKSQEKVEDDTAGGNATEGDWNDEGDWDAWDGDEYTLPLDNWVSYPGLDNR